MSKLTKEQHQALKEFAEGKICLGELAKALSCIMEINFKNHQRQIKWKEGICGPEFRIELSHIHNAMERHTRGEISTEQLVEWAAMILINDAFGWEGPDQDEISELLNDISFLTINE